MKLTFIGAGHVGAALAVRLADAGHDVTLAQSAEGSASIAAALARSSKLSARPIAAAIAEADAVFLATPFGAVEAALTPHIDALAGKILVDCTNPVGPGLSHGLESKHSGSAMIQALVPSARVVKAFTIYGYENLDDPSFPAFNVKPAMMFCGDDDAAKGSVRALIEACGFEPLDVGGLVQALHLEHMTLLWVRMVRGGGHSPHTVWAALRR